MGKRILVAYSSKYGATQEIAEKIGEVLMQSGDQVDVSSVGTVSDLTRYQAIILGSAIYVGKWPKESAKFLKANEKFLADHPFWVFSSGPSGEGDPLELVEGKLIPADLQSAIDRIHPRGITIFHGNINLEKINSIEKWAVKNVVKKPFGDFRDWNSIVTWSGEISAELKPVQFA